MTLRRQFFVGFIILCIFSGSASSRAVAPPSAMHSTSQPQVTTTDDGLIFEWRMPDVQLAPREDGAWSVVLPGYSQSSQPGAPELPFASALVALPPGVTPTLKVMLAEETERLLPGLLALAPIPQGVRYDAAGCPIGGNFSPAYNHAPARLDHFWRLDPARFSIAPAGSRSSFGCAAVNRRQPRTHSLSGDNSSQSAI